MHDVIAVAKANLAEKEKEARANRDAFLKKGAPAPRCDCEGCKVGYVEIKADEEN